MRLIHLPPKPIRRRRRWVPSKPPAAPASAVGHYYRRLLVEGADGMIFVQSEATAARRRVWLYLVDATDGITPETGEAGGQPQLSKNGAAWGNTTATLTAVGNGTYYVELTAGELDTLGKGLVRYKSGNTAEFSLPFNVVAANVFDAVRLGLTALPNANAEAAGGLFTRGTGAGQINQDANGRIDVNVEGWNTTAVPAEHTAGYPIVTIKDGTGTGEIDTNAGAIVSVTTVGSVSGAVGSVTGNVGGNVVGSVGSVATGGITRASLAADTGLQSVRSNTAQAGGATSITLDASASATDNIYNGQRVYLTGSTGAGQDRLITAYNGTTKVATVHPAWATNPDATSTFAIRPDGSTNVGTISLDGSAADNLESAADGTGFNLGGGSIVAASVTGAVGSVTGNVGGNVVGSVASVAGTTFESIHLDHLIGSADPGGIVANSSLWAALTSKSATPAYSSYNNTTDSLEAIRDRGDAAWITATGFSTHSAADVWAVAVRRLSDATNITSTGGTTVPQTGDSFARLGAPTGASVSADILTTKQNTDYPGDAVHLDPVNGTAGTTVGTHGTARTPCTTFADAATIATSRGRKRIKFVPGASVTVSSGTFTGFEIDLNGGYLTLNQNAVLGSPGRVYSSGGMGEVSPDIGGGQTTVDLDTAIWFENVVFPRNLRATDYCYLKNCIVGNTSLATTFTIQGDNTTDPVYLEDCYTTKVSGLTFSCGGGADLILNGWYGDFTITNLAAGTTVVIYGYAKVTIAASCTGGTVRHTSHVEVTNNGAATLDLVSESVANEHADALIARNIAGGSSTGRTVKQALASLRNKVAFDVPVAGQFTVFDTDDTTPLFTGTYTAMAGANPVTVIDPS